MTDVDARRYGLKIEGHDIIIRMHHEELIGRVHRVVTMGSLGE